MTMSRSPLLQFLLLLSCWTDGTADGAESTVSTPAPPISAKRLTLDTMFQNLRSMEYAVRGKLVIAANEIASELSSSTSEGGKKQDDAKKSKYPFDHIVYTNIGNPHSVGQKPLTWPRQVLALTDLPDEAGIDHPDVSTLFPADAVRRAREIKEGLGGHGTGAYSHSKGALCFRRDIAAFLAHRDGPNVPPVDPEDIFLTNGASAGISMILSALLADPSCGVMIPIPQYPIYSATIDMCGGHKVGYYLDERNNWDLNMEELDRSLSDARSRGINVVSFVLINPGNPTGQVLSESAVRDIVKFCARNRLVLLADEVYQDNVYDESCEFVSCKRAAHEAGLLHGKSPTSSSSTDDDGDDDGTKVDEQRGGIELVSFHSTSKGLFGECGRRGGYMEFTGIDDDVKDQLYKLASSFLCSTVTGQIMTSLMVRGPRPGDESYERHESEKRAIYESLKRRSGLVSRGLDSIPGFSCRPAQGSMYCFPSVEIPSAAKRAAERDGMTPDTLYCLSLLEATGICVVPASGFGQEEGRHGFRTTFLPPEEEMVRCVDRIREHYDSFCKEYSSS